MRGAPTDNRGGRRAGFRRGVESAWPLVVVVGLVGGTLACGVLAWGASLHGVAVAVFGLAAALIVAFGLLLRSWVATRVHRRRPSARTTQSARTFSRSALAPLVLFGLAALAALGAYFVVDPHFTEGRHGAAAIFGVIAAPILAVVLIYDPLASLLDRWLDRPVGVRGAHALGQTDPRVEGPIGPSSHAARARDDDDVKPEQR